jgi:hypothetical protein
MPSKLLELSPLSKATQQPSPRGSGSFPPFNCHRRPFAASRLRLVALRLQKNSDSNQCTDPRWTSRRSTSSPSPTRSLARTSLITPPPQQPLRAHFGPGLQRGYNADTTDTLVSSPALVCARRSRSFSSPTTASPLSRASCCPSPRAPKVRSTACRIAHWP